MFGICFFHLYAFGDHCIDLYLTQSKQVSGVRCQVSGFRSQVSGLRSQAPQVYNRVKRITNHRDQINAELDNVNKNLEDYCKKNYESKVHGSGFKGSGFAEGYASNL
jgi:peptidoglycan hydrolase CwlO-like protein